MIQKPTSITISNVIILQNVNAFRILPFHCQTLIDISFELLPTLEATQQTLLPTLEATQQTLLPTLEATQQTLLKGKLHSAILIKKLN